MAVNLIPPSRQTGTVEQQLGGLYSYLYQLVEALNVNLGNNTGGGGGTAAYKGMQSSGLTSASGSGNALDSASETYQELKALIIKTATEATSRIHKVVTEIAHEYTAQSEFGTYEEFLTNKISQGADGVLMEWDAQNSITTSVAEFSEYIAESDVYIQVGIVKYNDDGTVEAGVVIGKNLTTVTIDGNELITSQNLYALFTAEELSFWQDGVCRARYGMVEFMVEKGYIDEITTSLLQSSTFGAQLVLRDDVLSAIAANIDLAANESIKLVVQSTPAMELRTGTTVTITDEMFHVNSPETRFSIPDPDSEDGREMVTVDDTGLRATTISADEIRSDSIVNATAATDHAPATAADLQAILTEISGKWMTGDITIDASALTEGSYEITGLHGYGRLTITGGKLNAIVVKDTSCIVEISGSTLSINGTAATVDNAKVLLTSVVFDALVGVDAKNGAWLLMDACTGNTSTLINVTGNSWARIKTSKPSGKRGTVEGELYSYAELSTSGSNYVPTSPDVQKKILKTTKTLTWCDGWLAEVGLTGELYQGAINDGTLRRGCMWFDLSSLAGKTIKSAALTLQRRPLVGGSSVTIGLYGTTATPDSVTPAIGDLIGTLELADGASGVIPVTEAVKSIIAGELSGFMIYDDRTDRVNGKAYTHGYCKLYGAYYRGAPKITVTYE